MLILVAELQANHNQTKSTGYQTKQKHQNTGSNRSNKDVIHLQ